MSDQKQLYPNDTTDPGWRIQQLRMRRGLQQKALARLANVDAAFLNRMERGRARRSKPKPETIQRLLDAMDATPAEREAVFHVEAPPPSTEEIQTCVTEFQAAYEQAAEPIILVDDRWNRWYINALGRRMLALQEDEYRRCLGLNTLGALVDPSQPLYSRYSEEHREFHFAQRVAAFKAYFAPQQFDTWYLAVEEFVTSFPLGRRIWAQPEAFRPPTFMFTQDVTLRDPRGRTFRLTARVDILLKTPRFMAIQLRPRDEDTRDLLAALHSARD